jgi:hypothetical protein
MSPPVRPAASPAGIATPVSTTSAHGYFSFPPSRDGEKDVQTSDNHQNAAVPRMVLHEPTGDQPDLEKQAAFHSHSPNRESGTSQSHDETDKSSIGEESIHYTDYYRSAPPKSYVQSLRPWNGRLVKDKWMHVAIRPFILFAYPAVLWSSMCYALAVGWLIVLSESVAHIYQDRDSYNFTSLQVGLVYISPFVGGVLGTAVAGKISDIVVRFMARKNDGVYEPEFRLVMAIPIALSTVIGLMGFGWSAEEKDNWIVPTIFFGVISFGCSLASTTSVTFVVDSYRMYAGEALVTLNFSKSKLEQMSCTRSELTARRHTPRLHFFSILPSLARDQWTERRFLGSRRHSARLSSLLDSHVHIREKSAHVDCQEEPDGEVLKIAIAFHGRPTPSRSRILKCFFAPRYERRVSLAFPIPSRTVCIRHLYPSFRLTRCHGVHTLLR